MVSDIPIVSLLGTFQSLLSSEHSNRIRSLRYTLIHYWLSFILCHVLFVVEPSGTILMEAISYCPFSCLPKLPTLILCLTCTSNHNLNTYKDQGLEHRILSVLCSILLPYFPACQAEIPSVASFCLNQAIVNMALPAVPSFVVQTPRNQVRYIFLVYILTFAQNGIGFALPERLINGLSFTTDPFPRPISTQYPPTTTVRSSSPATSGVSLRVTN